MGAQDKNSIKFVRFSYLGRQLPVHRLLYLAVNQPDYQPQTEESNLVFKRPSLK